MIEFKLPSLGADMDEGTLLTWHVKPGDSVKRGQVVAVVDTSKAAVDVEIWNDGVLLELRVQPGEKVPVGTVLATLLEPGEVAAPSATVASAKRRAISPSARKRAKELGVDPEGLQGTGAQGAVTLADVEAAAQKLAVPPADTVMDRQKEMRRAIAAAMSRSKREIPHYYLSEPIPMDAALAWLQKHNAGLAITERILIAVLQLKAVALALQKFPQLNGFYRDGEFHASSAVHTGVAIALRGGGLVAPALHDVQAKSLEQLMRELGDLVKRARAGSLRSSEMSDPTITVTNLGDQGVELVLGVIYPPQVALVGFGRITERPWVESGSVRAASMVTATVAADHRVSDGHQGALFLAELRDLLQQPEKLAEVGKAAGGKV
jgi:pyruvate dehydrogenase E2 component (dihydrolipoamide acetyltransferase)